MPKLTTAELVKLRSELRRAQDIQKRGQLHEAEREYKAILARLPGHPAVLQGLGLLKHYEGKHEEALQFLREAVLQAPRAVEIRCNLAAVMGMLGRHCDAAQEIREALRWQPDYAQGWRNLGVSLEKNRDFEKAIDAYRKALELEPRDATAWTFLGNVNRQLKRWSDAEAAYRQSLLIAGSSAEVHHSLGLVARAQKRQDDAIAEFRTALSLRPNYSRARIGLARILDRSDRFVEAADVLREGLRLQPDNPTPYSYLGHTLGELGELDEVIACFRTQLARDPQASAVRSALLYTLHYHAASTPELLYHEHLEWGRRHVDPLQSVRRPHTNDRKMVRRLKVGYVSPDFREHTVPRFISPVIKNHSRDRFEIYCYSNSDREDPTKSRLKGWADHWREIRKLSDEDVDRVIREDGIDILVDLRGHAADNRLLLFARKPAPVQVVMVGYFDTTGLSTIDYRITDQHQDPLGMSEQYHVETLARLPETSWCYAADDQAPDIAEPPALTTGFVTFGSLNKIIKVTPECARLWATVLEAVGNSRLMLVVPGQDSRQVIRDRLIRFGLPPDRVVLVDKAPTRNAYLNRYAQIDIALDTYPFSGITTTCDALWMGVPTVTLAGATSVSRASRSIMSAVELGEFAATTVIQYAQAAAALARDLARVTSLRAGMRERMRSSPLMNQAAFTGHLESAFSAMWARWVATH